MNLYVSDCSPTPAIDAKYHQKVSQAYAESTARDLISKWSRYIEFCAKNKLSLYPPQPMNVARFLTFYCDCVGSFATVNNMLSAIKTFYKYSGYDIDTHHPIIDLLMKSCRRSMSANSKPKSPIELGHLLLIKQLIDFSDPPQYTFFLALVLQFFACLRVSNLVPNSPSQVFSHKHITRASVVVNEDNIIIMLNWSKTLQNKQDIFSIPIAAASGSPIDPVAMYKHFTDRFRLPGNYPVFAFKDKGVIHVLHRKMYIEYLKHYLARLGIDPTNYSSHSVRRGAATCLFSLKCPTPLLKSHGTWKSDAYLRYVSLSFEQKLIPTLKFHEKLKSLVS